MSEEVVVSIEGMDIVAKNATPHIGIALSMGGNVNPEFLRMLLERLREWMQEYIISIMIDSTIPLDLSRNNVTESARKKNCDYLFFIDSDVFIEQGYLERLLSHNKDVISGIYHQKTPPYYPLPRRRVAENLYVPIEPEDDSIIEIDGTGMGCVLIKMDALENISYPWFEFKYYKIGEKWHQLSEDLYLCQKLQDKGIKIYCDPIVRCNHIGALVNQELSDIYKEYRISTDKERNMTVTELSSFTSMSHEDAYNKWRDATELVAREYKGYMNQDHHSPKDFYKTNKNYIFDLTSWHMNQRRSFDMSLAKSIKTDYPAAKKILDFGSGCGQNAIDIAKAGYDVAMADYEGFTSQFARFRAKQRGLNIKFYDIEKPINEKFDIILAFDILEHIPDNEFEKTVELLRSLRANRGRILTTTSFGSQGGLHPMHYESSPEKVQLIETLNDMQI